VAAVTTSRTAERITVTHTCQNASGPRTHEAELLVTRTVRLGDGGRRVAAVRCDGRAVHVIFDAVGRDVSS